MPVTSHLYFFLIVSFITDELDVGHVTISELVKRESISIGESHSM